MIPVLLFDDLAGDLGPLSDLRASYEQRTGALSAVERWQRWSRLGGVLTAPAHQGLRQARLGAALTTIDPRLSEAILVNGRFDVTPADVDMLGAGGTAVAADGTIVAARCAGAALSTLITSLQDGSGAGPAPAAAQKSAAASWSRPWHLLDNERFAARLASDFATILAGWSAADHGTVPSWAELAGHGKVHVHATARIGANAVLDTTDGPILIDEGADVRHGAILIGPVYVGARSIVAERAHLKARTSIGPQCRVGGEIGNVLFQACSNKAHEGHLGDALVGEWANLGAGTVNSNLLNTYAEVAMRLHPDAALERSGRQFMGCLVGDHAKLAIGTRIMTGASIGTGTMWAATAPVTGAVAAFSWVTDDGKRLYNADKFVQLARTVMARRSKELAPAEEAVVRALIGAAANGGAAGRRDTGGGGASA